MCNSSWILSKDVAQSA